MPFPHEHSARIISPDKFEKDSFRSKEISSSLKDKVIKYLTRNPAPEDESEFHKFAETVADEHDIAEETAYAVLGDLLAGGKTKGKKLKVDPEQLKTGIKIELEHTKDPQIAEKIARDHLFEIPDYYTRLKKMESGAEKQGMKKAYLHVSNNLYVDLTKAIEERKDAPKSVPKEYKNVDRSQFGDSKNYLYPLDNEKHVRAAISYFGMPRNYQKYDEAERKIIAGKIRSAAKKYKIEISENWLKKFSLMEKARTTKYIKRIPKAGGGYKYIYKEKEKSSKSDEKKPKEDKEPENKPKLNEKNKGLIKNVLKKVANILAETLSGKDVLSPVGSEIEQVGESITPKKKEKLK